MKRHITTRLYEVFSVWSGQAESENDMIYMWTVGKWQSWWSFAQIWSKL
jgi:hypothetical protein